MSPRSRRIAWLIVLVAAALAASVAATEACQCAGGAAPAVCEQYKSIDVAFVGRPTAMPSNAADGRVHFRLTQALKGVDGSEVSVPRPASAVGGARCDREFAVGEEYVVFAMRNAEGEIDLSPCTSWVWRVNANASEREGTYDRKQATEAVALADSLRKSAVGGRVFGEVTVRVPFSAPDDEDGVRRVDGATVILRGSQQERRTPTVNGEYEFTGLQPGAYSVSVTMPDGLPAARTARLPDDLSAQFRFSNYEEREYTRSVTIADARDCSYAPFEAQFDGEISGTIVRHDGGSPGQQTVELFPTTVDLRGPEGEPARVYTDERGSFRMSHMPPGRYIVGINLRHGAADDAPFPPTFYRELGTDEPSIIELGRGTHAELGVLRLPPPLVKRQIAGTVTWDDGRPLHDVLVEICEAGSKRLGVYCRECPLRDDGGFKAEVFAGTTHKLRAAAVDPRARSDMGSEKELPPIGLAEVTIPIDGDDVNGVRLVLIPRLDRR